MNRPRRVIKPPPKTYWEEYVQTDKWYLKTLVEDIPPEEMWAALEDPDVSDAGEEGDSDIDEEEDPDFEFFEGMESDGDETATTASVTSEEEESLQRSEEGE